MPSSTLSIQGTAIPNDLSGLQLLFAITEATSGLTGKDFLLELTKNVSLHMHMDYCFIAECANADKSRLRTIAFSHGEKLLDNIEYNTSDSACQMMMTGDTYFLPKGAQDCFPAAKGIEAYAGAPIISNVTGEILGHIAATHTSAVGKEKDHTVVLKLFASRVAAEIERIKAAEKLEERNKDLLQRIQEVELYQNTFKHLQEAVFWVDADGSIFHVNQMACHMTGRTREELTRMKVPELNASDIVQDFSIFWKRLKKEKKIVFEAQHRHKEGYLYDVEIAGNFIQVGDQEFSCSIVRDIRTKRKEEELLKVVSEGTAAFTGSDYFSELAKSITLALGTRYALVTECANEEKTRVRTISYVDHQEVLENIEYDLEGTPCEIVMTGKDYFCYRELEKKFPKEKGIESYVSVPIYSPTNGSVLGHIAALDVIPMEKHQNQTSILRIFAARAGAEIERLDALQKLEKTNEELKVSIREVEALKNKLQAENKYLQEEIKVNHNFEDIISKSKLFRKILVQIEQVASTDATVLILGESGTGKELIARAVHNLSNRSKRPLVKINCATLPANLIESELFGHEKGAFTGALDKKIGRFELADGGTVFLDEIGELPIELQAKLLRVLQEGEFERLGNSKTMKVNVRIIAATNRNLQQAIEKKEFREDLFYRLNVFPIFTPPLRERKEDIPLLVKHFVQKYEGKMGRKITYIPNRVIDLLTDYHWPGNIRELENLVERALIITSGPELHEGEWLPKSTQQTMSSSSSSNLKSLEEVEREHILSVLEKTNWKVSGEKGAAKILNLNATTLEARMKKLGIARGK